MRSEAANQHGKKPICATCSVGISAERVALYHGGNRIGVGRLLSVLSSYVVLHQRQTRNQDCVFLSNCNHLDIREQAEGLKISRGYIFPHSLPELYGFINNCLYYVFPLRRCFLGLQVSSTKDCSLVTIIPSWRSFTEDFHKIFAVFIFLMTSLCGHIQINSGHVWRFCRSTVWRHPTRRCGGHSCSRAVTFLFKIRIWKWEKKK